MARKRDREDETPDEGWGAPTLGGYRPDEPGAAPFTPAGPATSQPGRARTWLVLLVSFGVQLAAVLAVGNSGVGDAALRFRADHDDTLGAFATIPAVFSWRLTPPATDPSHLYAAQLAGLLTLFVVAALLSLALVRGPLTFWRAFVGVTLAVLAATLAGGMVRRIVLDDLGRYDEVGGKVAGVLFQSGGPEIVGGALLGLLAGLVAAIVAVASRRPAAVVLPVAAPEPAPYVEPAAPPPWHGDGPPAAPPAAPPTAPPAAPPSLRKDDDGQATTRLPVAPPAAHPAPAVPAVPAVPAAPPAAAPQPAADQQTTAFRRPDVPARDEEPTPGRAPEQATPEQATSEQATQALPVAPPPASQPTPRPTREPARTPDEQPTAATQAFPRPPDDEDLGHHPDEE